MSACASDTAQVSGSGLASRWRADQIDLRQHAAEVVAADGDLTEVEYELFADIDRAIFDAEYDLNRGDPTASKRLRGLSRKRKRLLRDWDRACVEVEYRRDKLDELATAPDAATAADAVARWGLLDGRRTPKPLPAAQPPFALPTKTPAQLHDDLAWWVTHYFDVISTQDPKARWLINAQTGARKTGLTLQELAKQIEHRKAAGLPHRVILAVSEHRLSQGVLERAKEAGLNAAVFRGRSEATCRHLEATRLAQRVGEDVKHAVCGPSKHGQCADRQWCGEEGYFLNLALACDADLVIVAHNYLVEPLPKAVRHDLWSIIADEDFTALIDTERSITRETFTTEALNANPVRGDDGAPDPNGTERLLKVWEVVHAASGACVGGYLTAGALHDQGFAHLDMHEARQLIWARKVPVKMTPGMSLEARREAAEAAAINGQLKGLVALTHALERIASGDPAAAGLVSVRMDHDRDGDQVVITVRGQREPADWLCDLPILMMSATGRIDDVKRFFPTAEAVTLARAVEKHDRLVQVIGGFGRSTLQRHPKRLGELHAIVKLSMLGHDSGLVITHQAVEDRFNDIPGVLTAHHGAIAGHDNYRNVEVTHIIGGPFPDPKVVAALAAARGGGAIGNVKPEHNTAAALLKDGTAVQIPVLAYANPACQAVHGGIYDRSIVQAAGRPRPLERTADNPSTRYIFANVALPFPVNDVVRWKDIRPDRMLQMIASDVVWTNTQDMATHRPDLFKSQKAAEGDKYRNVGTADDMRHAVHAVVRHDPRAWVEITYQPAGAGQKRRTVYAIETAVDEVRAGIEKQAGKPIVWRVRTFTPGRKDSLTPEKTITYPAARESSATTLRATLPPNARPDNWMIQSKREDRHL